LKSAARQLAKLTSWYKMHRWGGMYGCRQHWPGYSGGMVWNVCLCDRRGFFIIWATTSFRI